MRKKSETVLAPAPFEGPGETDEVVYTLPEVAKICNIHRVTLKRMEDRGLIPKARWRKLPTPRRVFTKKEMEAIKGIVEQHLADKNPPTREYVD